MTEQHLYGSGRLLSIDFLCEACGHRSWDTIPKEDATYENRWDCSKCNTANSCKRVPSAARVHTRTFPDGYKRNGFQDLKEAAHLEVEKIGMPVADRERVTQEINRLEQREIKK